MAIVTVGFDGKTPGLLSSTSGIDLSLSTKQNLYTVPTGFSCIITQVVVHSPSAAISAATTPFGWNADANDVISATALTGLTGTTMAIILRPTAAGFVRGAAADVFGLKTTVQEGEADTVIIDVYGYLY